AKFDSSGGADGITNTYDGFGNLTSSQISVAGFTKAVASIYDLDNNRTQVTHPDAQAFTYSYDARDRLAGLFEGIGRGIALLGFSWNADDTLATRFNDSGTANYHYDPIGRLDGQSDVFPGGAAANVQWNFQISSASQISSETRDNDGYAFTGISAANKAYAVNGLNQYNAVGGTGYLYDASGNLTYDGFNAFTYDGENRLVSALAAGQTTTLTYDPLGRLFQTLKTDGNSVTRSFLYDGDALVAEYNQTGTLVGRYVHGSNAAADDPLVWYTTTAPSSTRYLHADHLGSIVAATNPAAAPSLNAYDEYGVPKATNVGRFQYTGQILIPELGSATCPGLYHYKARFYSPCLGRFLQVDPVGYDGGVNLYAYVANDPVNSSDPTGLYECATKDCPIVAKAIDQIREARDFYRSPRTDSRLPRAPEAAKALDKILGTLGKQDDGGVNIRSGDAGGNRGGFDAAKTITLDLSVIAKTGGTIGETLGHETQHYRQRGENLSPLAEEVRPLGVGYLIGRAPNGSIRSGSAREYIGHRLRFDYHWGRLPGGSAAIERAIDDELQKPF
ncbi:MAG: RHS repeat-associated core domain-containing protein, partial [Sphingomicrobium sp.]